MKVYLKKENQIKMVDFINYFSGEIEIDNKTYQKNEYVELECSKLTDANKNDIYEHDIISDGENTFEIIYEDGIFKTKDNKYLLIELLDTKHNYKIFRNSLLNVPKNLVYINKKDKIVEILEKNFKTDEIFTVEAENYKIDEYLTLKNSNITDKNGNYIYEYDVIFDGENYYEVVFEDGIFKVEIPEYISKSLYIFLKYKEVKKVGNMLLSKDEEYFGKFLRS